MPKPANMTNAEWLAHLRNLADPRCKAKHIDYYESLICVGPNASGFGPPCNQCIREVCEELETKQKKVHGRELSREETDKLRERLGFPSC